VAKSVKLYNDADINNMPEEITAQTVIIKKPFIQDYFDVTINAVALSINAEKLNSIYWGNIHVSDLIELTNSKHITSLPENFEGTLNVSPEVVKTIPRHKLPLYLNYLCGEAKEALLKRLKGIS